MIRLYLEIPGNFFCFIFKDSCWLVQIPFVSMVKFHFKLLLSSLSSLLLLLLSLILLLLKRLLKLWSKKSPLRFCCFEPQTWRLDKLHPPTHTHSPFKSFFRLHVFVMKSPNHNSACLMCRSGWKIFFNAGRVRARAGESWQGKFWAGGWWLSICYFTYVGSILGVFCFFVGHVWSRFYRNTLQPRMKSLLTLPFFFNLPFYFLLFFFPPSFFFFFFFFVSVRWPGWLPKGRGLRAITNAESKLNVRINEQVKLSTTWIT